MKRIRVTADVQNQLEGIFIQQEQEFFADVDEEILFDGGWDPDSNEVIYTPLTAQAAAIFEAAQQNVVALEEVDVNEFDQEGIRGLAVMLDGPKLLVQEFSPRQILERRFTLTLAGDTFNRLTRPTFAIGSTLAGVIEQGRIKFKKLSRIRLIFDLTDMYREATDAELDSFCGHESISVNDLDAFKIISDQKMRKLVHAIVSRGTLDEYTAQQIVDAGASQGFGIEIQDGKVAMPIQKANAKALLYFLDNGLYRGPLGGAILITNSKRVHLPAV
ncbi:hypothetical protein ACOYW6_05750 [Parablastomonas sp. CN1-191]|uniref:hypothetical protein n=1 Tax=Parablastomonas sp. CN1-191 TaxID=3400908 RepID=UPI003BF90D21